MEYLLACSNLYQPDISSMQFFPCCNFQPTTEASQKILHVLNMCTIIGSIGFHLTAEFWCIEAVAIPFAVSFLMFYIHFHE
jgi:hypothetical protein